MKCSVFLSNTITTYYIVEIKKLTVLILEPKTFIKKRETKKKNTTVPSFSYLKSLPKISKLQLNSVHQTKWKLRLSV